MVMRQIFSDIRPTPPLMGRDLNLLNGFEMGIWFFFKLGADLGIAPSRPASFTYKINLI